MSTYLKSYPINRFNRIFFWAITSLFILYFIAIPDVNAQHNCETALADAQSKYEVGRSLEVIQLLTSCLPDSVPVEQRAKAYQLLAFAYIAEELTDKAKDTIDKLLDVNKNYQPDISLHPAKFVEYTQQEINRRKAKNRLKNYILWGSAGVVVTVVVALQIFKGETPTGPLPEPPQPVPPLSN